MNSAPHQPGFLIDLDGLLINSEEISDMAFQSLCNTLGCHYSQEFPLGIRGTKASVWTLKFRDQFKVDLSPEEIE